MIELKRNHSYDSLFLYMSAISERCMQSWWMPGTPYILWDFVQNGSGLWGLYPVTELDVEVLKLINKSIGGWMYRPDPKQKPEFISQQEWSVLYIKWKLQGRV